MIRYIYKLYFTTKLANIDKMTYPNYGHMAQVSTAMQMENMMKPINNLFISFAYLTRKGKFFCFYIMIIVSLNSDRPLI